MTKIVEITERTSMKSLFDAVKGAAPEPVTFKAGEWTYGKTIVLPADGEMTSIKGVLNNLSYQLNMKLGVVNSAPKADKPVIEGASKGTKPSDGASKPAPRPWKLGVTLDVDNGIVTLDLGEHAKAVYDVSNDNYTLNGAALTFYSRKLSEFAASPREAVMKGTELENGKPLTTGWSFKGYTSTQDAQGDACRDILMQAVAKQDSAIFAADGAALMAGTAELVKIGDSKKVDFLAKWLPEPVKAEAPAPAQPSEQPSTLDVNKVDEGLRVNQDAGAAIVK